MRLERGDGAPLSNVIAEIWHCDALGRYSGFPPNDPSVVVTAAAAPKAGYLPGERFLRGRQITDAAGQAEFHTIYFPAGGVPAVLDIALSRDGYRAAAAWLSSGERPPAALVIYYLVCNNEASGSNDRRAGASHVKAM